MSHFYPNKLLYYRHKYRLTQEDVIEELDMVSPSRLSSWEQGKSMPSLPNLFKLCKLYGVTSEKLYPSLNQKAKKKLIKKPKPVVKIEPTVDKQLKQLAALIVDAYFHMK
jgi:transcriptional regulator with XRE-family HTH domain